jgi:cystathionine beta-lyase/cystathionine gamma-synthase
VHYGADVTQPLHRYFPYGFGGMVAVEFEPRINVKTMMRAMTLVSDVPSLGGTESTATMPAFTTNWFMSQAEKSAFGIDDHLVRFSIGLENPEDVAGDVLAAARATLP